MPRRVRGVAVDAAKAVRGTMRQAVRRVRELDPVALRVALLGHQRAPEKPKAMMKSLASGNMGKDITEYFIFTPCIGKVAWTSSQRPAASPMG